MLEMNFKYLAPEVEALYVVSERGLCASLENPEPDQDQYL